MGCSVRWYSTIPRPTARSFSMGTFVEGQIDRRLIRVGNVSEKEASTSLALQTWIDAEGFRNHRPNESTRNRTGRWKEWP